MKLEVIDVVYLAFAAVFVVAGVFMAYAMFGKLEKMESYLGRSRIIDDVNRRVLGTGLLGRQIRLGMITGCLIHPRLYVNRGLLEPADLAEFPKGLKILAVLPLLCIAGSVAAMWILIAFGPDL
ncbi:MAG: hypothetical protein ACRER8_07040 [Pseudomonas sp.]|uniref:hypothetical protein n=1 Tax=Pseudomonas sp. TaxID=306 RepID=UPI003D6E2D98